MTVPELRARVRNACRCFAAVQRIRHFVIADAEHEAAWRLALGVATEADLRLVESCVFRAMNPERARRAS